MYWKKIILAKIVVLISTVLLYSQSSGNISGVIRDSQTGDPLVSANIYVKGTSLGTASNLDGKYKLVELPAGKDTVVYRYIGYETFQTVVNVLPNKTVEYDVKLTPTAITGKEVIVTGQLSGQTKAINQQLSSNTIVNVVSSDKIQELPDQNVAESVGRLPGIAIQRNGGEGQKVIIRGLLPKFSSITINGVKVPATDPDDRSVDLSMISSDVLSGIEVFKALTPDMDADAIGGTVNLVLRRASKNFHVDLKLQDGYNDFASQFGQYKYDLSLSDRFFNDKLGIIANASISKANRSSDLLSADYEYQSTTKTGAVIETDDVNLGNKLDTRKRTGGNVVIDYDLGNNNTLMFNSIYSTTKDNITERRKRYAVSNLGIQYDLTSEINNTSLISNSLRGNHDFNDLLVDWEAAYSKTSNDIPYSNYSRFIENGAYNQGLIINQGVDVIPGFAKNDLSSTYFLYGLFSPQNVDEHNFTAQLNMKWPFKIGDDFSGYLKWGGKIRDKGRIKNANEYQTDFNVISTKIGQPNPDKFALYQGNVLISNFLDNSFQAKNFLNGRFVFGPGLDESELNNFYQTYKSFYTLNRYIMLENYKSSEDVNAGYIMAQFNIGKKLIFLPGFRVENTSTNYDGQVGALSGNLGQFGTITDSTGGQNYTEFLPMVHVRYKFNDEFDIRLAVTSSLSRPDYFNLVPYESIDYADEIIQKGNPDLKHMKAWNYDLYFSFYNNLGLFTVGLFYKDIRDIDYISQSRVVSGSYNGYQLIEPVNAEKSKVYGIELDLETNMTFLPSPFDGIIIGANYSVMNSETYFPFFEIGPRSPNPPYAPTVINTFRKGKMPGQANNIANLTIGYEKGNFSGRVSLLYQGKILQSVGSNGDLDGYSNSFARWDAQCSYNIMDGISIFLDFNNITNVSDGAFLGSELYPTNQEFFGWTGDAGIRFKL
jgi:TonB-dependent receptor